jgi:hypothetical protein
MGKRGNPLTLIQYDYLYEPEVAWNARAIQAHFREYYDPRQQKVVVAQLSRWNIVCAYFSYHLHETPYFAVARPTYESLEICRLYVSPNFQDLGVADGLVGMMRFLALKHDVDDVFLTLSPTESRGNFPVMLKSLGFIETEPDIFQLPI